LSPNTEDHGRQSFDVEISGCASVAGYSSLCLYDNCQLAWAVLRSNKKPVLARLFSRERQ
jgi:hypothetical protein